MNGFDRIPPDQDAVKTHNENSEAHGQVRPEGLSSSKWGGGNELDVLMSNPIEDDHNYTRYKN